MSLWKGLMLELFISWLFIGGDDWWKPIFCLQYLRGDLCNIVINCRKILYMHICITFISWIWVYSELKSTKYIFFCCSRTWGVLNHRPGLSRSSLIVFVVTSLCFSFIFHILRLICILPFSQTELHVIEDPLNLSTDFMITWMGIGW